MRRLLPVPAVAALLVLTACGSDPAPATPAAAAGPATSAADPLSGQLVVLAAASLTEVFEQVAADLEAEHPDLDVVLSFGASSALAQQVVAGAPADVLAAASPATMRTVVDAGDADGPPRLFARNVLEIAVPPGNPGAVQGLADLGDPERTVALCAEQVPCGAAAAQAFAAAGVTPAPDTLEQDVKAVLAKVRLGEVDAGLVYATDVRAAGEEVEGVPFPESAQAVNDYPVVALREAPNPEAAAAFVEAVLGEQVQSALRAAGFSAP